jgi:hypothetical protein
MKALCVKDCFEGRLYIRGKEYEIKPEWPCAKHFTWPGKPETKPEPPVSKQAALRQEIIKLQEENAKLKGEK